MLREEGARGQAAHPEENPGKRPKLGKCARVLLENDVAERSVPTLSHKRSPAVALGATQAWPSRGDGSPVGVHREAGCSS